MAQSNPRLSKKGPPIIDRFETFGPIYAEYDPRLSKKGSASKTDPIEATDRFETFGSKIDRLTACVTSFPGEVYLNIQQHIPEKFGLGKLLTVPTIFEQRFYCRREVRTHSPQYAKLTDSRKHSH
jgi:hypothetical protein